MEEEQKLCRDQVNDLYGDRQDEEEHVFSYDDVPEGMMENEDD